MSNEKLKEFIRYVAADQALQEQLGSDATVDQIIAAGKSAGFEFTADEFSSMNEQLSSLVELSDEDLDQVAGAGEQFLWSLFGCKRGGRETSGPGGTGPEPPTDDKPSGGGKGDVDWDEIVDIISKPVPKPPPGPLDSKTPALCV